MDVFTEPLPEKRGFSPLTLLRKMINDGHRLFLLRAVTGSGKTVVVAPALAKIFPLRTVYCTQPRVLTALTVVQFLQDLDPSFRLGANLGFLTGPSKIRIRQGLYYTTLGSLNRLMFSSPADQYVIIVDEAHEMSQELAILLTLAQKMREACMLVLMSATLDFGFYQRALGVPTEACVDVTRPASLRYELRFGSGSRPKSLTEAIYGACLDILRRDPDDAQILVFVSGKVTMDSFKARYGDKLRDAGFDLLALMSKDVQALNETYERCIARFEGPTVVLTTNVSETGVTFKNAKYCVDSGLQKRNFLYGPLQAEVLATVPVSKSNALQRFGRVGRTGPGVIECLYTEGVYEGLGGDHPREYEVGDPSQFVLACAMMDEEHVLRKEALFDSPFQRPIENVAASIELLLRLGFIGLRGAETLYLTELGSHYFLCGSKLTPLQFKAFLLADELEISYLDIAALFAFPDRKKNLKKVERLGDAIGEDLRERAVRRNTFLLSIIVGHYGDEEPLYPFLDAALYHFDLESLRRTRLLDSEGEARRLRVERIEFIIRHLYGLNVVSDGRTRYGERIGHWRGTRIVDSVGLQGNLNRFLMIEEGMFDDIPADLWTGITGHYV